MMTGLLLVGSLCAQARHHHHRAIHTHQPSRDDYAKAFGSAFFDSNDFDKALAAYDQVPAVSMQEHDLCNYSMAAYFLQQYPKALEVALYGLTQYPQQAALNRVAFFCATELRQYDNAQRYAEVLFHQCGDVKLSYYDYLYYGRMYTVVKNYQKADSAFACLAAEYPNALEYALYMRAKVNAQQDPDQSQGLARPYYEQLAELLAVKPQPDDSDRERLKECALYLLSYYYLQHGDQERASHYARLLLTVEPDNKTALQLLEMK